MEVKGADTANVGSSGGVGGGGDGGTGLHCGGGVDCLLREETEARVL